MTLLLRFLPHALLAVLGFVSGYWIADTRAQAAYGRLDAEFLQYRLDNANKIKAATEQALIRERRQAKINQELSLANAEKDAAITKLAIDVRNRVGALRLCQSEARDSTRVPARADHSADGDSEASAGSQLPSSIADDLVALAADADRVVNQLESCQVWAKSLQ